MAIIYPLLCSLVKTYLPTFKNISTEKLVSESAKVNKSRQLQSQIRTYKETFTVANEQHRFYEDFKMLKHKFPAIIDNINKIGKPNLEMKHFGMMAQQ